MKQGLRGPRAQPLRRGEPPLRRMTAGALRDGSGLSEPTGGGVGPARGRGPGPRPGRGT